AVRARHRHRPGRGAVDDERPGEPERRRCAGDGGAPAGRRRAHHRRSAGHVGRVGHAARRPPLVREAVGAAARPCRAVPALGRLRLPPGRLRRGLLSRAVAARIALDLRIEPLRLASPFRISGYVFEAMPAVVATLRDGARFGRGEAAGVYYLGDAPEGMRATLEAQRDAIERGLSRDEARTLLPPGGARNALDCALWELESQRAGVPVWKLAGLEPPRPLLTTFTVGADAPDAMARAALGFATARAIKLKLTGEADLDAARIAAVRAARPDVWLGVDANQGYVPATLERLLPALVAHGVSLLEQPCRRGHEAELDGVEHVVPIAADESVQGLDEVDAL